MRTLRALPEKIGRAAIPAASILILVCLLATSWITFDRVRSLLAAKDLVAHTQEVRASLETIYAQIAAAESDQRAYLLTLDEEARDRYAAAPSNIARDVLTARYLTKDNPSQGQRLNELDAEIAERFAYLDRSARARKRLGIDGAIDVLKLGEGFRAMGVIRSIIRELMGEENRLLAIREGSGSAHVIQAEVAAALSLGISVLLISVFGVVSNRLVMLRETAAEEERALRTGLEHEIERTKATEARLEKTMIELQRSNEELQNFAFVASHDLQEPLRKIRAFSDRVRRRAGDALDDESKDSLKRVEAAADRMQRLIMDLLELSRITTKIRPHVRIDPAHVIADVADDLQTRIDESGGSILYEGLPAIVADPAQVRQLFQNLLSNALKFRREGVAPIVKIEAAVRGDGRIAFRVSDNGIGFEHKFADRIFVVFQRLHGRGEYEGSGIGLAIVRKIVERHGGTIAAKSVLGEGATFAFDLPGRTSAPLPNAIVNEDGEE